MRSRVLIGVGAWLLGAMSATAGSLYAVDRLGQGLFGQDNKQVTVAMVNAEIALENADRRTPSPSQSPSPKPSSSERPSPSARRSAHKAPQASQSPVTQSPGPSPTSSAGQLLRSVDGTVVAACAPGGAVLLQESPEQGYAVDDVVPGPAAIASVVFRGSSGGVLMKVSCVSGQPVAHVTPFTWHDE